MEDYRQPWETGDHWELKREFIERYKHTYPIDKLLCLAQAYSNIELLHCSYPIEVMKEIHELSKPLKACKIFRGRSGITFSNPNGATTQASRGKRKASDQDSGGKMKFIKFCSASDASKINENSTCTETKQPAEQDFNLETKQPAEQDFNLETKQPAEQDLGIPSRVEVGCCAKDQPANPVTQNKADVQLASRANNFEAILAKMKKFAQAVKNQKFLRQTDWAAIHKASAITQMELTYDIEKIVRRQTNSRISHRFNCKLYIAGILVSVAELAGRKKAQIKATEQAVHTLLDSSNEYEELLKLIENFSKSDSHSSFSVSELSGTSEELSADIIDVKQNNESLSPLNSPNSNVKQVSDAETNTLYEVDIDKTKLLLENEFGLDFMQKLASEIKCEPETNVCNAIVTAARVLKIDRVISFKFDVQSSSSIIFTCTIFMKNIVVGIGKGPSKKVAKKLAASYTFAHLLNSKVWLGDMDDSGTSSKAMLDSSDINATTCDSAIEKNASDHKKYVLLSSQNCKKNPYQYLNRLSENSGTCSITEKDIKSIFALIKNLAKYVNFPSMHAISNASQKAKISNDIVYNVAINEDTTVTSKAYLCEILFKNILISSGIGRSKVKSKYSAADAAVEKLNNLQNFIFVERNKEASSLSSSSENCSLSGITPTFKLNRSLLDSTLQRQFVIMDNSETVTVSQRSPGAILQHSAAVCQKSIVYQHSECIPNDGSHEVLQRFDGVLDGIVVGTGICNIKAEAKRRAAADALANLKKVVYTIKVKDVQNKDDIVIRREQLINSEYGSGALTDTNIGCKMLKSMGWTGGGIGKTSGIVEPIMADKATFRNQGIGYSKKDNSLFDFRKKIQALLQDFKKSNSFNDLIFSKDFSKQERKEIHGYASRLHLNSNSYGVEKFRQLFIRNKYTPFQLLDYLVKNGGSTNKYNLLDLSTEE